jgi:hypothetical protein
MVSNMVSNVLNEAGRFFQELLLGVGCKPGASGVASATALVMVAGGHVFKLHA